MSQDKYLDSIRSLSSLGFTELEAAVYSYLVENSPATPYRVAQEIGKPVANTYKAVEALYQKGAVLIDETKNRSCQAISPDELLGRLKHGYLERHQEAADALSRLKPAVDHEKIFSLATPEQVLDRTERLIGQAETVILVDAFPGIIGTLRPWLEAAAARGITVVLQAYEPVAMRDVEVVIFQSAGLMLDRWHGQWLILVVDGAEYLFAFMGDDGTTVHNAIWCGSAFLALPQHSNLALSFRASVLEDLFERKASPAEIQSEIERTKTWLTLGKRGYDKLAGQFGQGG